MAGDYYTCVQRILNHVNPSINMDFARQNSDIKRVLFVRSLDFVTSSFTVTSHAYKRNAIEAKKSREKGNSCYQRQEYSDALEWYTKSILQAPVTPPKGTSPREKRIDEEFSLALANRSATLYQLGRHSQAIKDIHLSVQHGYPKELRYKIYDREGKCYMEMGRYKDAMETFEKGKKYMASARLDEQKRIIWRQNMDKSIEECVIAMNKPSSQEPPKPMDHINPDPPGIKRPIGKVFTNCCDSFTMHYEDSRGRFAVAKCPIRVGDVVIAEQPFVSVLSMDFYSTHCYHCFKRIESPLGCFGCSSIRYCSGTCRDTSWTTYHKWECPYMKTVDMTSIGNIGRLVLRLILVTGLSALLQKRQNNRDHESQVLITERNTYAAGYEALLDLVGNSSYRSDNEMFQYTILTVYLLMILEHANFFEGEEVETRGQEVVISYVGGLMLRFLQIITCNGIEIMETHCSGNVLSSEQVSLGLGLFPSTALVNHACDPSMELIFYGNTCVARAIHNIPGGTEISIDYGYVYYLTNRNQRQFCLKSQYYFDCECEACDSHWPMRLKLPSGIPSVRCGKCDEPIGLKSDFATDPTIVKCRTCGSVQKPMNHLEEYYESSRVFDKAVDELRRGKVDGPCHILERHLSLMEKYLVLPMKEYVACLSALKQCYRVQGNYLFKR